MPLLLAVPAAAQAQKYPVKPIRMIVGYAPGGGSDIMGRLMAQQITEALGQQVIVENRAGAAQNVAAEYIAKQPADGYTLFLSSAALGVNISLYPKLNYHPQRDFAPVAVFATAPNLLLVHPSFPAKNLREFIAVAKKNPGKLNFSSSGSGSAQHLSGELLKIQIGVDFTHVPYKGSAPSMTALASGEVDFSFNNIPSSQPLMTPGRVRALAITSIKRSPLLPELPTMNESGLSGFVTRDVVRRAGPDGNTRRGHQHAERGDRESGSETGFPRPSRPDGRRSDRREPGLFPQDARAGDRALGGGGENLEGEAGIGAVAVRSKDTDGAGRPRCLHLCPPVKPGYFDMKPRSASILAINFSSLSSSLGTSALPWKSSAQALSSRSFFQSSA